MNINKSFDKPPKQHLFFTVEKALSLNMKFTTLFLSVGYLATIASAQTAIVSITSPLSNTNYKAGSEAIISWVNPSVPTISQIVLAKGPSTGLQPVMTIATNVDAKDLRYTWKIPDDLPDGTDCKF